MGARGVQASDLGDMSPTCTPEAATALTPACPLTNTAEEGVPPAPEALTDQPVGAFHKELAQTIALRAQRVHSPAEWAVSTQHAKGAYGC